MLTDPEVRTGADRRCGLSRSDQARVVRSKRALQPVGEIGA